MVRPSSRSHFSVSTAARSVVNDSTDDMTRVEKITGEISQNVTLFPKLAAPVKI